MRKKRVITKVMAMLLSFAVVFSMIPGAVFADSVTLSGDGTADNPYLISDKAELEAFRDIVNGGNRTACARLEKDINLDGTEWTPIGGNDGYATSYYGGTFDGNGKTVSNFKITAGYNYGGFFSYVKDDAYIKNLIIEKATITSTQNNVGGIVGTIISGRIEQCSFSGSVTNGKSSGGYAGGIAGYLGNTNKTTPTIKECVNKGQISALYAGGITGYGKYSSPIENCYNTGAIKGTTRSGGIVGQNMNSTKVNYCYNRGSVTGTSVGAISGFNGVSINNCYWDNSAAAAGGGTGSASDCEGSQNAESIYQKLKDKGFAEDSNSINEGYPVLAWEKGGASEPKIPSISIDGSSVLWVEVGGKNVNETTLTVSYENMGDEKPDVKWEYPAESDAVTFTKSENDKNALIVKAKNGGTVKVKAIVAYDNKEYEKEFEITVIPHITTAEIKNINGGAVAVGQTVKAVVNTEGGQDYDKASFPALTYQWYDYNVTTGKSKMINGATGETYEIPEGFTVGHNLYVEVKCAGQTVVAYADSKGQPVESADKGKLYPVVYDKDYTLPNEIKEADVLDLKDRWTKDGITAAIEWSVKSVDSSLIDLSTGKVTLPEKGKELVELNAKYTYKGEFYNRTFKITIWSQEEVDKERADKQNELKKAVNSLGNFYKLYPVYGIDTNVTDMLKADLKDSSIDVAVKSVTEVYGDAGISDEGNITYFYADPDTSRSVWFGSYKVTFTLIKDGVSLDLEDVPVIIYWDKGKVENVMTTEILNKVSEADLLGENKSLGNVTSDLVLPKIADGKKWTQISWTSSDDNVISISSKNQTTADTLFNPYVGTVKQGAADEKVTLTAAFTFQRTNEVTGREEPVVLYKTFDVTVKAIDGEKADSIRDELKAKLEAGFEKVGLTDAVTGEKLVQGADGAYTAVNDIKYPATGDFGVDGKYYPVVITSSNNELIASPDVNNAARTTVYRPAVGQSAEQAKVTVTIYDKNTSVSASKEFTVNVPALTQEEIDAEKALMTKVKAVYFDGIKNGNTSADNITSDMKAFQEVYADEDGNLVWVYDSKALVNHGIVPTALDGWYTLEAWRMFKSSNAGVVTHENLLVNRQKENKAVKITSALSSETLGKYGELYKKDPVKYAGYRELVDLYYQEVSADVIVKGTAPTQEGAVSETLSVNFALKGDNMSISSTAVTGVAEGTSAFEIFDKVLRENGYSYTSKGSYVSSVTSSSDVTLSDDDGPNSGWLYTVNGIMPNEYMGSYIMKNNDSLLVYYTADWTKDSQAGSWADKKTEVTTSGGDSKTTTAPTDVKTSGNTATATVTEENAAELIKQAKENKSSEIVINVSASDAKDAETVNLELDKKTVESIVKDTEATVTVKTPAGEINLDKETLKQIAGEAEGNKISIEITKVSKPEEAQKSLVGANGQIFKLAVKSGNKVISKFKGTVTVRLAVPTALKDKNIAAVHIEGSVLEKLEGRRITQNKVEFYEFKTPHFSEFALIDTAEVKLDSDDKNDSIDKAKSLTKELKLKAVSSKTAKKNVKVTVKMNSKNNTLIKELSDMGYTVKYRYYRSVKKASKYTAVKTKNTKTYINTKGKRGSKYYYKVRAVVYDGDKVIAQSALKQCKYAVRTWSK